jgi:coproporphyrinogen III oxidase
MADTNSENGRYDTVWGNTFIPFGREGDMDDTVMTAVFQQQHAYLQEAKQRIVQKLSDIDEVLEIETNEERDDEMEGSGTTLWNLRRGYRSALYKETHPSTQCIVGHIQQAANGF